ncbi:MAG: DNA topoisomerase IB [Burkholderiaceae bacterium]
MTRPSSRQASRAPTRKSARPPARGRGSAPARPAPTPPADVPPGLAWVCDSEPGLTRRRVGDDWHYFDADGRRVRDEATLARIRRLAIPPAYESVWICARADGHLQATGRDARGRKQYRYHPLWQQQRGEDKFEALRAFGAALPRIRRRVQRDLAPPAAGSPTRTLVLATLVRLLDTTFIRVGNEEYARGNGSYGLTTLRTRHAGVRDAQVRLTFKGKSGVPHEVRLDDRRVAAVVRRCKALPGQELFQYVEADGSVHKVSSSDVNDYLHEIAGTRVTAKDFRTWHGSVLALEFTRVACAGEREPGPAKVAANKVIAQVAARLRNTVAVCRKSYIHPEVLALGTALGDDEARAALLEAPWARGTTTPRSGSLSAAERRLLALLAHAERARRAAQRALAGRGICLTAEPPRPSSSRKGRHAESLGFHDAQRPRRPTRRDTAARRAGDG